MTMGPTPSALPTDCHGFEPQGHEQDSYAPRKPLPQSVERSILLTPRYGYAAPKGLVIGLGGLKKHGKDTVADHLVAQHGFVKLGMSDTLAVALHTLNPLIPVRTEAASLWRAYDWDAYIRYQTIVDTIGYTAAKDIPEVRRLLQVLGTEVGRDMIDENVWVDITRRNIEMITAQGTGVALTGVRFRNELDMLEGIGTSVYVDRPGYVDPEAATSAHSSENSLTADDFEVVLINDGTLEDLYAQADDLLGSLSRRAALIRAEGSEAWPVYDR